MPSYKEHKLNDYFQYAEDIVLDYFDEWDWIFSSMHRLPLASGVFKIGHRTSHEIEVVYIGHTTCERTLCEVINSMLHGFEGGERLAMFLVDPVFKKNIMIQWRCSVYPEELIEDELEEFLATHHRVPEFNDPIDDDRGIWVVVDEKDHPSNTIAGDYD